MDGYLGMIMLWPMAWAPRNWAICDGSMLSISDFQALYSLLGTNFGGDGRVSFGLPDLRGRVPVGMGTGPGLATRFLGQMGGYEQNIVSLTINEMPAHTHDLSGASAVIPTTNVDIDIQVSTDEGERIEPQNNDYLGKTSKVSGKEVKLYREDATNSVNLSGGSVQIPQHTAQVSGTVGEAGHGNQLNLTTMQPYLGMNYIICVVGTYPSRS